MPDKLIATLTRFSEQNHGMLLKRAREKAFERLSKKEVKAIEAAFSEIFLTT